MKSKLWNKVNQSMPPWLFLGVTAILVLIVSFMASQNISTQRESSMQEMLGKGMAIIRAVEAGTRINMYAMPWGNTQLQRQLEESALFPEVIEIAITDTEGFVMSSSNPQKIGQSIKIPTAENIPHPSQWAKSEILWVTEVGYNNVQHQRVLHLMSRFEPASKRLPTPPFAGKKNGKYNDDDPDSLHDSGPQKLPTRMIHVYMSLENMDTRSRDMAFNMMLSALLLFGGGLCLFIIVVVFQNYRSTKASLYKMKAFADNIVEKMPIGLVVLDGANRVVNFNRAAEDILSLDARDVLGKMGTATLLPKAFMEPINVKTRRLELQHHDQDGHSLFIEMTKSVMKDDFGNYSGALILFRDLTEIKTLQQEIMLNKHLASIGRFAAGVAHEIRNPLSSIKGFASYFRNRYKDVEADVKIADIMIDETERLNKVITQLLEFSRPIHVEWSQVKLNPLISDSLALIEEVAKRHNVSLVFENAGDIALKTDPDKVRQILLNIYLNSIQAMPQGGVLTVSTSIDTDEELVEIHLKDTGTGISKDNLEKIFDPYFTTKSTGTGLGLVMVATAVEALQGRINVESDTTGTEFIVYLPLNPIVGLI